MTDDDDNPYRFVDVSDEEQALEAPDWDLRDYVEPAKEPIFGPDEILALGERWSGFLRIAIFLQAIALALAFLLLPAVQSLPRGVMPPPPPVRTWPEPKIVAIVLLLALGAQTPVAWNSYRLARSLRFGRRRSLTIAATCLVPLASFVPILGLGYQTMRTLRRHGIRSDIFGPHRESLPRAAE